MSKRWEKSSWFFLFRGWETNRNGWDLEVWNAPWLPFGGWHASAILPVTGRQHKISGFKTRRGAMRWATDVATGKRTP